MTVLVLLVKHCTVFLSCFSMYFISNCICALAFFLKFIYFSVSVVNESLRMKFNVVSKNSHLSFVDDSFMTS